MDHHAPIEARRGLSDPARPKRRTWVILVSITATWYALFFAALWGLAVLGGMVADVVNTRMGGWTG